MCDKIEAKQYLVCAEVIMCLKNKCWEPELIFFFIK